jgi:MFS transporter, DHA1 family, tetracycline resistance protein
MTERIGESKPRDAARAGLSGLLLIVFIDALSYSMILPLLPFLVMKAGGSAWSGGLVAAVHALAAAAGAPVLGTLSDKFGRRAMLLLTLAGTAIGYGLLIVSASIPALLAARAFSGAMAGNMGVVTAGIADITSDDQRARGMGLSMAFWALGFVAGPFLSAVLSGLAGTADVLIPALAACGATCLSWLFVAITLRDARPARFGANDAHGREEDRSEVWHLLGLLTALAFCQSGLVSMTGFWAASTHHWGPRQVSLLMLWAAFGVVAFQVLLVGRLARRFGDLDTLAIGLALTCSGCAALMLAPMSLVILAIAVPLMFGGITMGQAMANTRLSRISSAGRRGSRMGRATAASAIGRVIGPAAGGALFVALGPLAIYGAVIAVSGAGIASRLAARAGDTNGPIA